MTHRYAPQFLGGDWEERQGDALGGPRQWHPVGHDLEAIKSFAETYGCGLDLDDESRHAEQLPITRRMAYYLWFTATVLHDDWRMYAQQFDTYDDLWRDLLPPVAARHANPEWLTRFAHCFEDIANRLRDGDFGDYGVTNCTGDEAALVLVLRTAHDSLVDSALPVPPHFDALLPPCGAEDEDFSLAHDVLSADADVEVLWNPSLDGIENEVDSPMRFVNLHPRDWFLPFS